ncbi:hypothetical protein Cgig2_032135 [Carnegiea gigantea]|uniref:Uncharacterized protein n=1 Tax=Carnegiea gigantea TaxID=171969 RepID=A0A9Q1GH31_9CARY|nr:hypothetical protein Cgig2_032135 [Carnegiea gigantea]
MLFYLLNIYFRPDKGIYSTICKRNGAPLSLNLIFLESEITNRSLKRRLRPTANFCDFYNIFCDVVSEWRSKENGEDHRCSKGIAEMVFPSINILKHALSVYTIEAFLMFEKAFINGASYKYKEVDSSTSDRVLHACCVNQVPDKYINQRWCRGIKDGQNLDLGISTGKEPMVCSSVWKM